MTGASKLKFREWLKLEKLTILSKLIVRKSTNSGSRLEHFRRHFFLILNNFISKTVSNCEKLVAVTKPLN